VSFITPRYISPDQAGWAVVVAVAGAVFFAGLNKTNHEFV
jgi:hypothetical protein